MNRGVLRVAPSLAAALAATFAASCDDGPRPGAPTPDDEPMFALEGGDGTRPAGAVGVGAAFADDGLDPPPLAPIAGMGGMRIDGERRLGSIQDGHFADPTIESDDHITWSGTRSVSRRWMFPARARIDLVTDGAPAMDRERHQRIGRRAWMFEPRNLVPVALEDGWRPDELRYDTVVRAAVLWPDGFDWRDGEDGWRVAAVDDPLLPDATLRARPRVEDSDALAMEYRDATTHVDLVASGRIDHPSRHFPERVSLTIYSAAYPDVPTHVLRETYTSIDPRARYDDALFEAGTERMRDERDGSSRSATEGRVFRLDPIPARPWKEVALDAPTADVRAAAALARAALSELPDELRGGARVDLVLDAENRVVALRVKLAPDRAAPTGFEPGPSLSGRAVNLDPFVPGEIARRRAALEAHGPPAPNPSWPPYLHGRANHWQLVVPDPPEGPR